MNPFSDKSVTGGGGWTYIGCGAWVPYGAAHFCSTSAYNNAYSYPSGLGQSTLEIDGVTHHGEAKIGTVPG
jgi:hypothetical protein